MTTPNKCEHGMDSGAYWDSRLAEREGGIVSCSMCGQRFVPSDVLEECREFLRYIEIKGGMGREVHGRAEAIAARIDAVLGKEAVRTWGVIRCHVCAGWLPCPPKGLIPLHPTGTGKNCRGGNTFPEFPDWIKPPEETEPTPPQAPEKPKDGCL